MERPSRIGLAFKVIALVVVCFLVIYPFLNIVATSFATEQEITRSDGVITLFPHHPTLEAYRAIFEGGVVTRALMVSIGVTVIGTALNMIFTVTMAWGLSRPIVAGRFVLTTVLLTMLFGAGIIPNFLLVKALGLYDSYAALVLPGLISAFNFLVLRNFFMNIPQELIDSARIDGAGEFSILIRIVLPLSKAVLAVVALFYAVSHWNAFFNAMLYLSDTEKWPLPLVLRLYVLQGQQVGVDSGGVAEAVPSIQAIQMAVVVVALVPILLVYPFLQRYFTKGVLTGAIKG
ncbi:ABC transporter permease [Luteipulveratus mongoliensis]|uniref:ABC transporter permease n=2 Tax=Luteipulveratus mongoliensis TaxID=571913 RepID=A0A0K1JPS1_9MICO|nr:ABC transporter permease [Luteipulveratus mongoliensis]